MEEVDLLSKWTDTYVSEFSYASLDDIRIGSQRWIGSYHESDLQYIFGQPLLGLSNSLRHENDSEVARLSMAVIKSFANYGEPKLPSYFNITWPKYERSSKIHLELCDQPKLGKELLHDRNTSALLSALEYFDDSSSEETEAL
ncbi:hypothetical protein Avbf_15536 [Armadillidium vulgare]|nr:hypothetical protein Avbf_15536 [Armadillidium vulgare]